MSVPEQSRGGQVQRGNKAATYDTFVNPYTFVPFPQLAAPEDFRRTPAGHHRLSEGRLCGWVDVELTAQSPLLVRNVVAGDEGRFPRRDMGGEQVPFIPGSSLAGTVRSLFELLAGGCLRVFQEDFLPGYRDVAKNQNGWTLAVIESAPDGRPRTVRLCSDVVWIQKDVLLHKLGASGLVTGDRVNVDTRAVQVEEKLQRRYVSDADHEAVTAGDEWVVLVTDAATRSKSYWCAVGQLSQDHAEVTDAAWRAFRHAVAGADDIRQARAKKQLQVAKPEPAEVTFTRTKGKGREATTVEEFVGHRHQAREQLFPGQVVWARVATTKKKVGHAGRKQAEIDHHEVQRLSLSQVWRHAGEREAGERVPDALHPCRGDSGELCPACRVFGSADTAGGSTDTTGKDQSGSRQSSYRGHVRFGEAVPSGPVTTHYENLPPLGAPRPGAGQFYLRTDPELRHPDDTEDPPFREWGAEPDKGAGPRELRGRKAYWLTARHRERPLFRVRHRVWPDNSMASAGESVAEGAVFTFRVQLDGLERAEIGGVLTALDPSLLLGEGVGLAVGGGRPLGYGSCTSRITDLRLEDARARYAGQPGSDVTVESVLAAFREATDAGVQDTWPAAAAALTLDRVDPGNVWYPPQAPLPKGELNTTDLQPGFKNFWVMSQGQKLDKSVRPLVQLPEIDAPDQGLWVTLKGEERSDTPSRATQGKPGRQGAGSSRKKHGRQRSSGAGGGRSGSGTAPQPGGKADGPRKGTRR